MKESLADTPCPACTKDSPKLLGKDLAVQLGTLKSEWQAIDNHHLEKRYIFKDFSSALTYVNHVAALAEEVNHHPDLHLSWGQVIIKVWSHVINGISQTDIVFAAKCDRIFEEM